MRQQIKKIQFLSTQGKTKTSLSFVMVAAMFVSFLGWLDVVLIPSEVNAQTETSSQNSQSANYSAFAQENENIHLYASCFGFLE